MMKAAARLCEGIVTGSIHVMPMRERSSENCTSREVRTNKDQGRYANKRIAIRQKLRSVQEAVRNSERLSKDDFAIRINAQT
jgi:hypothetical protein